VATASRANGYSQRANCPCCNTSVSAARDRVCSSPRAEDIPFTQHGRFLSGYAPQRVFFTYVRCAKCDCYYCPIYYSPEQLQSLYEQQAENMAEVPRGSRQRTQDGYLDILRRHSPMRGGLLEVGADVGLFAEACARAGQFDSFWLAEPNQAVHGELERRFAGRSITVLTTMSPAAHVPAGAVSTAVMIHVLDHVLEPRAALRDMFAALEPAGVLMIVTHNVRSWLARLLGRRWPPFTLQHPQLFSPEAIRLLLTSCGFQPLEIAGTTNYFPAIFLARAGLTVLGLPANWLPQHGGPDIGVQLGNMCAVARRPGQ
jgi:2-polyprenyl-3-methyl-5-hydroxy-6-metoxy-1,4-benzoquinol methylase